MSSSLFSLPPDARARMSMAAKLHARATADPLQAPDSQLEQGDLDEGATNGTSNNKVVTTSQKESD